MQLEQVAVTIVSNRATKDWVTPFNIKMLFYQSRKSQSDGSNHTTFSYLQWGFLYYKMALQYINPKNIQGGDIIIRSIWPQILTTDTP